MSARSPAIVRSVQIAHPHLNHLGFSLGGGAVCGTDKGMQLFPMPPGALAVLLSCCVAFLLSRRLAVLRSCLRSCCLAFLLSCVLAALPATVLQLHVSIAHASFVPAASVSSHDNQTLHTTIASSSTSGYSSAGRASDCRSLQQSDGPWFDSGWPDCCACADGYARK